MKYIYVTIHICTAGVDDIAVYFQLSNPVETLLEP